MVMVMLEGIKGLAMYFEDIYTKVEPLWERSFTLEGVEPSSTYVESIRKNYSKIEYKSQKNEIYSWWEFAMIFTMYQILTAYALEKWRNEKLDIITLDEIPVQLFEKQFLKNMEPEDEFEGNDEYLRRYKGFKNPPSPSM